MKTKINNGTIVISAFPGCGKTYAHNDLKNKIKILDSDSSNYHWITDENGNNVKDPAFPNNYISHVKENINGKVDIILVSSHKEVRNALAEAGIDYILVYPCVSLMYQYIDRFKKRGSSDEFINKIKNCWTNWVKEMRSDTNALYKIRLNSKEYLLNYILEILEDEENGLA